MYKQINNTGRKEIKEFLKSNQIKVCVWDAAIDAWCADAEFQLSEGNPASIELRSWQSKLGRTTEYTISPAGIDTLPSFGE